MIVIDSSLVYDSKISVASVAIGSLLPISLANRDDCSLTMIMKTTREMMYIGKTSCSKSL